MTGVKTLILEDEYYTRKFVRKLVSRIELIDMIYDVNCAEEALQIVNDFDIDLALLDIELIGDNKNGLDTAKLIRQIDSQIEFIFITAYSEYALESYDVHPFDYIVKPIDEERLLDSLNKLINKMNKQLQKSILTIEQPKELLRLPFEKIVFLEKAKENNKVNIYLDDNKIYQTTKTLQQLEDNLDNRFIRAHRSYLVNSDKVLRLREIAERSYEIDFSSCEGKALLSRYKYSLVQDRLM